MRPEDVELSEAEPTVDGDDNVYAGKVATRDFLGDYLDFQVKVGDVVLLARAHPSLRRRPAKPIYVRMKPEKCVAISTDIAAAPEQMT